MKYGIWRHIAVGAVAAAALVAPLSASATPVSLNVSGTFTVATGTLSDLLGEAFSGGFAYDTDTSLTLPGSLDFANPASGGTGQELGGEFATPLGFATPSSGGGGFTSSQLVVESENNVTRTSADLLNLLPGGIYDFFGLTAYEPGTTTNPGNTIDDGNAVITGVSVDLVFVGDMFGADLTALDSFPTTLDLGLVSHVVLLVEEYENEVLIGQAYQFGTIGEGGTFNSFTIECDAVVSEPLSIALFGLGLGLMGLIRRKQIA